MRLKVVIEKNEMKDRLESLDRENETKYYWVLYTFVCVSGGTRIMKIERDKSKRREKKRKIEKGWDKRDRESENLIAVQFPATQGSLRAHVRIHFSRVVFNCLHLPTINFLLLPHEFHYIFTKGRLE